MHKTLCTFSAGLTDVGESQAMANAVVAIGMPRLESAHERTKHVKQQYRNDDKNMLCHVHLKPLHGGYWVARNLNLVLNELFDPSPSQRPKPFPTSHSIQPGAAWFWASCCGCPLFVIHRRQHRKQQQIEHAQHCDYLVDRGLIADTTHAVEGNVAIQWQDRWRKPLELERTDDKRWHIKIVSETNYHHSLYHNSVWRT